MAKKGIGAPAQAGPRHLGRHTIMRVTGYYLVAGALLLLLTALFPQYRMTPAEAATHNTATKSAEPTMPGRRDTPLMFIDTLQGPDRRSLGRKYPRASPGD